MNIKTVLLLSAAVSFAVWSCPEADAANGYEAPLPPPELGEHLTSYRTDNQKKGAPSSVYDRNAGVTGNRKNDSSGSGNNLQDYQYATIQGPGRVHEELRTGRV